MDIPQEKLWTRQFVILTLCNFLLFLNLQMIVPSLPSYVKDVFGASDVTVSLVTSLFALSAVVARVFAGQALQRGKRNLLVYGGLGIALLATASYYWCGVVATLLLMRVLFGLGFGMVSTTFPTMTSNVVPAKRLGEGMGYFGLSTSLAMSVGPMIGLTLLGQYGFGTLVAGAVLVLAAVFPLSYLVRSVPVQAQTSVPAEETARKQAFWSGLFTPKLLLPFSLNFMLAITYGGVLSFLALFGKEAHIEQVGNFFLLNAVSILLVRPVAGRLYDRKGHLAVMVPGALAVMSGLAVLSFATSMSLLAVSALLFGAGFGTLQPSIQTWMIQRVTPEQRGMANGMFLNSTDLGIAGGSMLLGAVAMQTSYAVMYRISAVVMLVFVLVYVWGVFGERMRKSGTVL